MHIKWQAGIRICQVRQTKYMRNMPLNYWLKHKDFSNA